MKLLISYLEFKADSFDEDLRLVNSKSDVGGVTSSDTRQDSRADKGSKNKLWDAIDSLVAKDKNYDKSWSLIYKHITSPIAKNRFNHWLQNYGIAGNVSVDDAIQEFVIKRLLGMNKGQPKLSRFLTSYPMEQARKNGQFPPVVGVLMKIFRNFILDTYVKGNKKKQNQEQYKTRIEDDGERQQLGPTIRGNPHSKLKKQQLRVKLIEIIEDFWKTKRNVEDIEVLKTICEKVIFEDDSTRSLAQEYVRNVMGVGATEPNYRALWRKLEKRVNQLMIQIKKVIQEKLDYAHYASMQAYFKDVAQEGLTEIRNFATILANSKTANYTPGWVGREQGFSPTYTDLRTQAYMEIDLAVSYSAVVFEVVRYCRENNVRNITVEDFYAFATRLGFPIVPDMIPEAYLRYLFHRHGKTLDTKDMLITASIKLDDYERCIVSYADEAKRQSKSQKFYQTYETVVAEYGMPLNQLPKDKQVEAKTKLNELLQAI